MVLKWAKNKFLRNAVRSHYNQYAYNYLSKHSIRVEHHRSARDPQDHRSAAGTHAPPGSRTSTCRTGANGKREHPPRIHSPADHAQNHRANLV